MISDATYAAIGQVAVQATALELTMAQIVMTMQPGRSLDSLLRSTPQLKGALDKAVRQLSAVDAELASELGGWRDRATTALDDRHAVVHSVMFQDEDFRTYAWHPRTDTDRSVTSGALLITAWRIGGVAMRGAQLLNDCMDRLGGNSCGLPAD